MRSLSLFEAVRGQVGGDDAPPPVAEVPPEVAASLVTVLAGLTDRRSRRGVRHSLASLLAVVVVAVACGAAGPLAAAQLAEGFSQELLAALGCRRCRATGLLRAASAATLSRLHRFVDVAELETALSGWAVARVLAARPAPAGGPAVAGSTERDLAREEPGTVEREAPRSRRSRADELREVRDDGWVRTAPRHPWVDPAVCGDPAHQPDRPAVGVDGKERRGAKSAGRPKTHLLAALVHASRVVVAQQRVENKTNEKNHFQPLLDPLPLEDVVLTADAMQTTRKNVRYLRHVKKAHYLLPVLGNQPHAYALADALDWAATPVVAATVEHGHGRIETRTLRILPAPAGLRFTDAAQVLLVERYVTVREGDAWRTRTAEAVLFVTSLTPTDTTPADLLAHVRGHWRIEHTHWVRDVVWKEDDSLLRTGDSPQLWSALTNLTINLFRLLGVTGFTRETRRNTQDPQRILLHLLTV